MESFNTSYTAPSLIDMGTTDLAEKINTKEGHSFFENQKVLVLTPDLRNVCGVSNYYNTIRLDESIQNLEYFFLNTTDKENAFLKLKRLVVNYWIFIRKLHHEKYNLIHINPSLNTKSFLRDGLFCMITILFKINFVIFFRGWENNFEQRLSKSRSMKWLFNHSYRRCLHYIVLGQSFRDKLLKLGVNGLSTQFWIESTVADSTYLNDFSISKKFSSFEEEIKILFISRIVKSKGTFTAIEAFDILRRANPYLKIKLVIAGDGNELLAAKELVRQNSIESVEFLGLVKGEQKKDVLLSSHILLFPTEYGEGLPNCILEAMLYGMPVISRYNGAISDVVTHEENGFLTDSVDPVVFSDFLQRLTDDTELYQKIAINNHLKAIQSFTKEKVKNRILDIYSELLLSTEK